MKIVYNNFRIIDFQVVLILLGAEFSMNDNDNSRRSKEREAKEKLSSNNKNE